MGNQWFPSSVPSGVCIAPPTASKLGEFNAGDSCSIAACAPTLPRKFNHNEHRVLADGTMPGWSRGSTLRAKRLLEHTLTWAYYRTRRHELHPLRKKVGDPYLPLTSICREMRIGIGARFEFWKDLRPPFQVISVKREMGVDSECADGTLYRVEWFCAIEHSKERMWNLQSGGGTFDNRI